MLDVCEDEVSPELARERALGSGAAAAKHCGRAGTRDDRHDTGRAVVENGAALGTQLTNPAVRPVATAAAAWHG